MPEPITTYKGRVILFNNGVVDVKQGDVSLVDSEKVAHIPEGNVKIDELTIIKNADNELEVPFDNQTIYRDPNDGFIKARGGSGGKEYTAGANVQISPEGVISATDTKYTAGTNIIIENNVISTPIPPFTPADNGKRLTVRGGTRTEEKDIIGGDIISISQNSKYGGLIRSDMEQYLTDGETYTVPLSVRYFQDGVPHEININLIWKWSEADYRLIGYDTNDNPTGDYIGVEGDDESYLPTVGTDYTGQDDELNYGPLDVEIQHDDGPLRLEWN